MRYLDVEIVSFPVSAQASVGVREMREIPSFEAAFVYKRFSQEDFDAIAARNDVYGEGAEADSYKLHEANAVAIIEAGFDYSKIRKVTVPV